MKQRITSLDVRALAQELSIALVSLRVANIYDLSSKILLLKFAKPDNKKQFIIDCGFRCHLTQFTRTTAPAPSDFVMRLRKILKTRRVSSVSQIGTDRIIEFQFSDGLYKLYLEFFAAGNVILTDADHKIMALWRNVSESEGQEPQRIGLTYSIENRMNVSGLPDLTVERVKTALQTTVDRLAAAAAAAASDHNPKKIKKKKMGDLLRWGLALTINELPPVVVDHAMLTLGFDATASPAAVLEQPALLDELVNVLKLARSVVDQVTVSSPCKGYILAKAKKDAQIREGTAAMDVPRKDLWYKDFHPFLPKQFENNPEYFVLEYDGFNKTVDEFYSSTEGQKLESRVDDLQAAAQRKIDLAKKDQAKRIDALQTSQMVNMRKAAAIEANAERVQEAMDAVIGLIEQGMPWPHIAKLIEREKSRHNPVAEIIQLPLKLDKNIITLVLGDADTEEDMDDEYDSDADEPDERQKQNFGEGAGAGAGPQSSTLEIDINLLMTPWANARDYYTERKSGKSKEQRTVEANRQALKNVERKVAEDLRKGLNREKAVLLATRTLHWFEKFVWFLSSDGYLVLSGRDPQQNELLYRKYFKKGDVFVHADIKGAGAVFIKNNVDTPEAPIPPATLAQAGSLAVCSSSAWDTKASMSAWWAAAHQVHKASAAGDFLPIGSFNIKGEKHFLPPAPLLIGLGLLWKISESSIANHVKHRVATDEPVDGKMLESPSSTIKEPKPGAENDEDSSRSSFNEEVYKYDGEDDESKNDRRDGEDDDDDDDVDEKKEKEEEKEEEQEAGQEEEEEEEEEAEDDDVKSGKRQNPLQTGVDADLEDTESDEGPELQTSNLTPTEDASKLSHDPDTRNDDESKDLDNHRARKGEESDDSEKSQKLESIQKKGPSTAPKSDPQPGSSSQSQPRQTSSKRGQKSKLKKIAKKYKDQDDEDRAAAEKVLGATAGRHKREQEAKERAKKEAELEAVRARRRAQHERFREETAKHEAARVRKMDLDNASSKSAADGLQGDASDDDAGANTMQLKSILGCLVGTPAAGDEILEVLPVCAPLAALNKVKYKVKLQPGNTKKGKATKDVLEKWNLDGGKKGKVDDSSHDVEKMWPRELELIKSVKPNDMINIIPVGKVSVMTLGAAGNKGKGKGKKGTGGKK